MKKSLITIIDKSAEELDTVIVSGGKIGYQVELSLDKLKKVVNFKLEDITD